MTSPLRQEAELFEAARALSDPTQRLVYLDSVCAGDPQLRLRLEHLLEAYGRAGQFFDDGAAALNHSIQRLPLADQPGDRIGRYKLLQKLGEGGCGIVYMAEQETPVRRKVAVKVIKLGMDTTVVVARFEAERQALAMMDHTNIAKVLDAGTTESGRPFFAMELVRGIKITDYCDQQQLPARERLELLVQVCQAVQHAHQKGIIHRDLKPSNILVTVNDGVAVPKVIDFGIAKAVEGRLTDQTLFTAFEQFLGTPAYMSPEQAAMTSLDIDTRTDIYSLGVLLYELLTGTTPFDTKALLAAGLDELRRTIREQEPVRPSTRLSTMLAGKLASAAQQRGSDVPKLLHLLRGDLDWIVMKCLEKDRSRRYETAHGLAMDIRRHLNAEPVLARPPSRLYEFQKTIRRHKLGFAAAASVIATLVAGILVSTMQAQRARHAEQQQRVLLVAAQDAQRRQSELELIANREARDSKQNLYAADIYLAQHALEDLNFGLAQRALEAHRPKPGEPDLRGFEWRYFWGACRGDKRQSFLAHSNVVSCLARSPDGKWLASGSFDRTVKLWDIASQKLVRTLGIHEGVFSVSFSPDSSHIAAGCIHGPVEIWGVDASGPQLTDFDADWACVAFCPTENTLAVARGDTQFGGVGTVRLWDFATKRVTRMLPNSGSRLAFAPDGSSLVIGGEDCLMVLDMNTRLETRRMIPAGNIFYLSVSPDKRTVATTTTWDHFARLWDVDTGRLLGTLDGHSDMVWCVAFAPNGKLAATGSTDQTVMLWDVGSRKQVAVRNGHLNEVWSAVFANDGLSLYTGSKDESIVLWDATRNPVPEELTNVVMWPYRPVPSPDSRKLALGSMDNRVRIWDLPTAQPTAVFESEAFALAWSPDGTSLTTLGTNGSLSLWDVASHSIRAAQKFTAAQRIVAACSVTAPSDILVTASADANIVLWDTSTLRRTAALKVDVPPIRAFAISSDRNTIALDTILSLELWDVRLKTRKGVLKGHKMEIKDAVFSPDGKLIATGSSDGSIKIWETATSRELATLVADKAGVVMETFSPDGKTLVSCSGNRIKLWNMATLRELAVFPVKDDSVWFAGFTPNGNTILFGHWEGTLHLLNAPDFSETDPLRN